LFLSWKQKNSNDSLSKQNDSLSKQNDSLSKKMTANQRSHAFAVDARAGVCIV
jgi:hypothetical protein